MATKDINKIATKCAEIFIKANLKHIKLENIHNQKQKYSEYYANGEMPESDYNRKIARLNKQEMEIKAKFIL